MKKEHFILLHGTLYITFQGLLEAGWKEDTIKKANLRNGANWMMAQNPYTGKKMTQYDSLIDLHKEKIAKWLRKVNKCKHEDGEKCECGNPYEYMAKEPIRKMIVKDLKAEAFFLSYTYEGPRGEKTRLPIEPTNNVVAKYTNEASILNMLLDAQKNAKEVVKKGLGLQMNSFFKHVGDVIANEQSMGNITNKFPTSMVKVLERMRKYKDGGYACLIHPSYGNGNALKIKDEVSESVLKEMLADHRQYDYQFVCLAYNEWAGKNGYKTIDRQTVANWHNKNKQEIDAYREGREVYNSSVRRKVSRMRPTQPTFLWESDDNHLDWWFAGDKANEYRKIKGIIVTDSFNDYILGYAITDGEMPGEIVKLAYLDAVRHIKELTGNYYLPFEVKTDQWNINQLKPFYQSFTRYEETPVGSKNRGWLENFFGHVDWERSLKIGFDNYTGHNITAKTPGVNLEVVKANKKIWPHISEAANQMATHIERLRTMPRNYDKANKSRQQEWLEAWAKMPSDKKILITEEQFLLKFGLTHSHQNRITDQGIKATIMGNAYQYAVPPAYYIQNNGKQVNIIYDPYDMNRVLVTDGEGLMFCANSMTRVAGCMADMQEFGGRSLLNQILAEAKADSEIAVTAKAKRTSILLDNNVDVDTVLKLGATMPKELKQRAEAMYNLPLAPEGEQEPTPKGAFVEVEEEDEEDFTQMRLARK